MTPFTIEMAKYLPNVNVTLINSDYERSNPVAPSFRVFSILKLVENVKCTIEP